MGDPRRARKKYMGPMHPWQKERIEQEVALKREYGLKTKKEIWIQNTLLKQFITNFKKPVVSKQAELEREQLITRLTKLGILKPGAEAGEILALGIRDILERRLQTVVCRKGLAHSMKQARQFITHRHIMVDGSVVTSPSYLVSVDEQSSVQFVVRSVLANEEHPERMSKETKEAEVVKGEKPEVSAEDTLTPEQAEEIVNKEEAEVKADE